MPAGIDPAVGWACVVVLTLIVLLMAGVEAD